MTTEKKFSLSGVKAGIFVAIVGIGLGNGLYVFTKAMFQAFAPECTYQQKEAKQ